ncbi:MAG: hypothetical protein ACOYL6_12780 [Bacteriovoracaceae bacterium]
MIHKFLPLLILIACSSSSELFVRRYEKDEHILYHLKTRVTNRQGVHIYRVLARAVVTQDENEHYSEEFSWSDLSLDEKKIPLNDLSIKPLKLSLAPKTPISVPNYSGYHPALMIPALDLTTIYADLRLAHRYAHLDVGEQRVVKHGVPVSWADGKHLLVAEDAIDFVITLVKKDEQKKTLEILIKHTPPDKERVQLFAPWMKKPVNKTPNNWVQVKQLTPEGYLIGIGHETFSVRLKMDSLYGKIIEANLENTIEILERTCSDAAWVVCEFSDRYQLKRELILY